MRSINNFWFRLFIILLFSLPVYSMYFNMFFDAEDFELLMYRPFSELKTWYKGGNFFHYIPLPMTLYTIEYHIFPDNPIPYRMVNYFLHVCCALLIYKVLLYTSRKEIAFFASIFFSILPVHLETVVALNHRQDLFYTLFSLLSLFYFIKYIKFDKKISFYILSFLFFILGILSKESTIMLPFLLLCYNLFFDEKRDIKTLFKRHLPFFFLGGLYILYRFYLFGSLGSYGSEGRGPSPYTFGKHILTNYNWYIHKLSQPFPILTMLVILILFFHSNILKKRILPFAFCWTIIALMPVFPFKGERFLYLASLGYVYFLADLFFNLFYFEDKESIESSKSISYFNASLFSIAFLFMGYFGTLKSIKNILPHDHKVLPILIILLLGGIYFYHRKFKNRNHEKFAIFKGNSKAFAVTSFILIFIICNLVTLWFKEYDVVQSSKNYKNIHDCIKSTLKDNLTSDTELYLTFHSLQQSLHTLTLPPVYFVKHTKRQNYYFWDYYQNRNQFGPIKDYDAYFFEVENWNCTPRNDITELIKRRSIIESKGKVSAINGITRNIIKRVQTGDFSCFEIFLDLNPLQIERIDLNFFPILSSNETNIIIEWISEKSTGYDREKSISVQLIDAKKNENGIFNLSFDVGNSLFWNIYGNIRNIRFKIPKENRIEPKDVQIFGFVNP